MSVESSQGISKRINVGFSDPGVKVQRVKVHSVVNASEKDEDGKTEKENLNKKLKSTELICV